MAGNLAVDFLRPFLAANALPKRWPVVQIVGNDGAMFLRGLDGFEDQLRRGVAEGRKNAAGVKPTHTELAENVVPVEIAGLQLTGGGVTTIRNADGPAHSEAAFGKV